MRFVRLEETRIGYLRRKVSDLFNGLRETDSGDRDLCSLGDTVLGPFVDDPLHCLGVWKKESEVTSQSVPLLSNQEAVQVETKEQRFQRLATKRTQAALQKVRLLGNLTSSSYSYTPEQAAKIIGALRAAVGAVEAKLNRVRNTRAAETSFTL